jgi:subtilisin family serine protease
MPMYFQAAPSLGEVWTATGHPPTMRLRHTSLALATLSLLVACGGGGDAPASAGSGGPTSPVSPASPSGGTSPAPAPAVPDIVVQLKAGAGIDSVASARGLSVVERFGQRPIWRLRVAPGGDPTAAVTALRADGSVRFAETVFDSETPEGRKNSIWAVSGDEAAYAGQWAPKAIGLDAAHALGTGTGLRIAILDTGIDATHPALAPRLARRTDGSLLGRDFVDDDADPSESGSRADAGWGHGTHVAGLAALAAPGARLMPVRVLDPRGRGNTWVMAEALAWAVDPDANPATDDGAHVINLSIGTLQRTELLKTITELVDCSFDDDDDDFKDSGFAADRERCARRHAAVVIAAAGNGASETEEQFPAAEPVKGALSVAASTAQRQIASFSNRGSWIGIAAPGEAIVSTVPGGGWGTWSGTSMAAPLTAGVAALVLQTLPPGGDPSLPNPRQWTPELVVKRVSDKAVALCGTSLKQLDAPGAVTGEQTPDQPCP